jgi:hypothetical protein
MVLDVTRALVLSSSSTSELAEDRLVGLANDVAKDIEATTVGHANDNILDAIVNAAVNEGLHARNQRLAALETEALLVLVLCEEEQLEAGTPDEAVEDAALLVNGVLEGLGHLKALAEPVALLTVGNVDKLNTVGAAIDLLAGGDNLAQGHLLTSLTLEAGENAGAQCELGIEVLLGELVVVELELLGADVAKALCLVTNAERVNASLVVTASLVGADEQLDLQVVGDVSALANADAGAGSKANNGLAGGGHKGRRRGKGLGDGHVAALHVLEVDLPRDMDALGVLLPLKVHLVNVIGCVAGEKAVIGIRRGVEGTLETALGGEGKRAAGRGEAQLGAG